MKLTVTRIGTFLLVLGIVMLLLGFILVSVGYENDGLYQPPFSTVR